MANTYTQLLVQLVFAVKGRQSLITESIREPVQKYICGIITNNGCKPLAIYCNPDHIHISYSKESDLGLFCYFFCPLSSL